MYIPILRLQRLKLLSNCPTILLSHESRAGGDLCIKSFQCFPDPFSRFDIVTSEAPFGSFKWCRLAESEPLCRFREDSHQQEKILCISLPVGSSRGNNQALGQIDAPWA